MYSITDTSALLDLFDGNSQGYGITAVTGVKDGKAQANSKLVYGTPSPNVWQNHLEGKQGIGIAPIKEDGTCAFGAIDIDNYTYDILDIVKAIYDFEIPLIPCFSKSKKLHLYVFFGDDVPAEDVIEYLKWWVMAFGCDPKTEIFPKQRKVSSDNKFYSWINMPYFDANNMENPRKVIARDGTYVRLEDAIPLMQAKQLTMKEHQKWLQDFRYHDAPPCVLSGLLLRDIQPGMRNNWMFNVGVYLTLKDENCDLATELSEINNSLQYPLDERELQTTVVNGFQRKTYYFMCEQMIRCNKSMCRQQDVGIDSKASTGLDYGELTQYITDPPYYEWIVNGQKLSFWNENEILGQNKFRALCLRQLHIVPKHVDEGKWTKILNKALEHLKVIEPSGEAGDFTSGSTFMDLVNLFFNGKRRADNITQVQMGRVYFDVGAEEYVFTAKSFMEFVTVKNNFTAYTPVEIRSRLQNLGAHKEGLHWHIPMKSIPEPTQEDIVIDFRDKENADDPF